MKKALSLCFGLFCIFVLSITVMTANVEPVYYDGNDSNPNNYTPPTGCIHYEVPGSGSEGTYTVKINNQGAIDPNGTNEFTITVGIKQGNAYTEVLSWSSNFPIYAVIVKGGDGFNLYQYADNVRNDVNLVSPLVASGNPANVSHVSIVYCLPIPTASASPKPTATQQPTQEPTLEPTQQPTQEPTQCPTEKPTQKPTQCPTEKPTQKPTQCPTEKPTQKPTQCPTEKPTQKPTQCPTEKPTQKPTQCPTEKPTQKPTQCPTEKPTQKPTQCPTTEPHPKTGDTNSLFIYIALIAISVVMISMILMKLYINKQNY